MPLFADAVANLRGRRIDTPVMATDMASWYASMGGSVTLSDGLTASYYQIYRTQPWVWAAVNTISRGMMRMPIKTYKRGDESKRVIKDGNLYRLTEQQPAYRMAPSKHRHAIAKQVAIYGNSFVVKLGMDDETSTPTERLITPAVGWSAGSNGTYIWTNPKNGDRYPFERWRIEHYCFWDTDENGFGISPLEPLRSTLANDDGARRYGIASFRNGAKLGSILKTDQTLKPEVATALKAELMAVHGGVDNAFKTAVFQQGLDFATVSHDLEKAAVVQHRELTPVEVAAVYCVPASQVGWTKDANFASIDAFHTALYQDALGAWVVMIEEQIQVDLVDPTPEFDGLFVEIDMNGVMRGDETSRYRNYAVGINAGFLKPKEPRNWENLEPVNQPEADQIHIPSNLSGATGAQVAEGSGKLDRGGSNA